MISGTYDIKKVQAQVPAVCHSCIRGSEREMFMLYRIVVAVFDDF